MKDIVKYSLLISAGVLCISSTLLSQTCSCAGAPILSSLETGAAPAGKWLFGVSYESHAINDVVDGTRELKNPSERRRNSESLLMEASYGINRFWTITGMLTLIEHEREVPAGTGLGEMITSSGVGEGILLMKYSPLRIGPFSGNELSIGGGAKFPVGSSNRSISGVTLSEDMQPSTGSLDGILWAYAARSLTPSSATQLYMSTSYRFSGRNEREFDTGDEMLTTLGISHRGTGLFGGSLGLRYRWAAIAGRRNYGLPNTGGQWLYLMPGLSLRLPKSLSLNVSTQLPLVRKLKGVQFSTSYIATVSLFWSP